MTEVSQWKKIDDENLNIDGLGLSNSAGAYWQKMMGAIARKFSAVDTKLEKVEGALVRRGEKATVSALPATGNSVGDYWTITADGSEWAWNGAEWYEIGNDDAVHKAGTETITGKKIIANDIRRISSTPNDKAGIFYIRIPDFKKGTVPSWYRSGSVTILDDTGTGIDSDGVMGAFRVTANPDGSNYVAIGAIENVEGGSDTAMFYVGFAAGGVKYATVPNTPDRSNGNDVITRSYMTHYAKNVVYSTTPVLSVTLAEDIAPTESDPYVIALPDGTKEATFWIEMGGNGGTGAIQTVIGYGSGNILMGQSNILANGARMLYTARNDRGRISIIRVATASTTVRSAAAYEMISEPVIVSPSQDLTSIAFYLDTQGTSIKTGSKIVVYAATEV